MAARKSKTIRANPLDAISALSMKKLKAPVKTTPVKTTQIKTARSKKSVGPALSDKKLGMATEVKIVPLTDTGPKKKTVTKKINVSVSGVSKPSARSPSTSEIASARVDDSVESGRATQQANIESKPTKKCAEDIFARELQELSAANKQSASPESESANLDNKSATPDIKSVIPELPPEAYAEVKNPQARVVIKQWAQWSAVGSMVPAPFMGTILISAAQIKMIHALCKSYDVPFERNLAVVVATGLVGGSAASGLAELLSRIAIKTIPYLGTVFSLAVEPALSYASSYAIGMSFVKHFEAGGTLANFNASEMKSYFSENVARCLAYFRDRKKNIFASKSVQS
ncbi:MAG: hypothetical protein WCJ34_00900 [Alcaligenaceae bacterium]